MVTISTAILHDIRRDDRAKCLADMIDNNPQPFGKGVVITDQMPPGGDWHAFKTHLALRQWEWSLESGASHCLFMTDDLHLAPGFYDILLAMVTARPEAIIGLLSNHPKGPSLWAEGHRGYRCNSWVVGPAYLVPRIHLEPFVAWYKALRDDGEAGGRRWYNDDSALNDWNTNHGPGASWHPLPTIVEHRADLPSTVGHGDKYSRERVSWRAVREVEETEEGFTWCSRPVANDLELMGFPSYWAPPSVPGCVGTIAPMLSVGE